MKICKKCGAELDNSMFNKNNAMKDNLDIYCKECVKEKLKKRQRSIVGLISRIYGNQKTNSKRRGHKSPEYSLEELKEWMLSQELYKLLYHNWKDSGYKRGLSPSCDRIDNNIGYSISNIRLMTWEENKALGHNAISSGEVKNSTLLNGGHCAVEKFDVNGNFICSYISMAEASRKNNVHQSNITRCCDGKIKKSGGFIWKRANGFTKVKL